MITGEIPRVTEFEKGFPLQYKVKNKFELVPDPCGQGRSSIGNEHRRQEVTNSDRLWSCWNNKHH
jgi:hypothetical protein